MHKINGVMRISLLQKSLKPTYLNKDYLNWKIILSLQVHVIGQLYRFSPKRSLHDRSDRS